MTDATADDAPATPFKAGTYSYYVLFLLFLGYVMNFADRQVVAILAQDIKTDLGLSDTEMGLLTGPAIALFYAVLGVPMAYVADRVHRVRLLAICLVLWSGLTALGGVARNLVQLALTRVGVSIAEAGGTPISASLLADYFPPERRATALGFYSAASAVGVLFGFALGGIVNDLVGWRWAMVAAGTPGVILAVLMLLTLREPKRGAADPGGVKAAKPATGSMWDTLKRIWSIPEYRRIVIACSGANMSVYVLLAWAPSVALRSFDVTSGQVGIFMGLGIALLGAASLAGTGLMADAINKVSRVQPVRLIALFQYLVVPLMIATLFAPTFLLYMVAIAFAYAAIVSNSSVAWLVTQNATPPEMRASAAASMALVFNLVGLGLGPPLVGFISDQLTVQYGDESLRYALMLVAVSSLVAGLLLSFWVVPAVKAREAAGRR
ncbi:spinster family MFS transporter [Terricaulis silvestris]|uniref:L-galactonate transporter n=1 Tax=Terricaulis silvestris TaxID=2686094 RepID=A0A6I6ML32_9CAUL|nr:MFS transporter [Terricaulis silvestris]QGZ93674.1 L-galactonate transporter [Terricaulis silvestris]